MALGSVGARNQYVWVELATSESHHLWSQQVSWADHLGNFALADIGLKARQASFAEEADGRRRCFVERPGDVNSVLIGLTTTYIGDIDEDKGKSDNTAEGKGKSNNTAKGKGQSDITSKGKSGNTVKGKGKRDNTAKGKGKSDTTVKGKGKSDDQGGQGKGTGGGTWVEKRFCAHCHLQGHLVANCQAKARGEPAKEGPTPRPANSLEQQHPAAGGDWTEERGMGGAMGKGKKSMVLVACGGHLQWRKTSGYCSLADGSLVQLQ